MRRALIGIVSCLTVGGAMLALSACGSSSESISKAEFLKQGNQICENGDKQIREEAEKQFPESGGRPSNKELEEFASDTVVPNIQSQLDEIEALGSPSGDEEKVEAILSAARSALDKGKQDPSKLIEGDAGPFERANELANSYGLTACGSSEEEG